MMITLQITKLTKGLNAVNSACEEVRFLCSPFAFLFLGPLIDLLISCSSDTYFTKAKRYYGKYSVPGEHIEPRNWEG